MHMYVHTAYNVSGLYFTVQIIIHLILFRSYLVMRTFPWQMFLDFWKQAGKVQIHVFLSSTILFNKANKFYHFCRDKLGIAEYSLSQSTLETIFNHFAANSWDPLISSFLFHKMMHGGCNVFECIKVIIFSLLLLVVKSNRGPWVRF